MRRRGGERMRIMRRSRSKSTLEDKPMAEGEVNTSTDANTSRGELGGEITSVDSLNGEASHQSNELSGSGSEDDDVTSDSCKSKSEFDDLRQTISIRSRSFYAETISLRYNLLREEHVKSLCVSLIHNQSVKRLDLRCCRLSTQSCQYLSETLSLNHVINSLDLSENSLKTAGLLLLHQCLKFNTSVTTLQLDCNDFIDSDAVHIYNIHKVNKNLKELSLIGNGFLTAAGEYFQQILQENFSLRTLNVSWNQFRMKAAVQLTAGLEVNSTLTELDISWNGLGLQGCVAMANCLRANDTLKVLNMSSNRITREAFTYLINGLFLNQTLEILRVGDNPITTDGVMDFMNILVKSDPEKQLSSCKEVDFAEICVGSDFAALYAKTRKYRDIIIKHGSALRQADMMQIELATVTHSEQPVFILFDCMRKANLRIVDLFHAFDKDRSGTLTRQELKEGLLSMGIPLSSRALDLLIKHTDTDNDGEVCLPDLLAVQKDYQKYLAKKRNQEQKERQSSAVLRRIKASPATKQY